MRPDFLLKKILRFNVLHTALLEVKRSHFYIIILFKNTSLTKSLINKSQGLDLANCVARHLSTEL